MTDNPINIAKKVLSVFLVPNDFASMAKPLQEMLIAFPNELCSIAESFIENLHGVNRTLSIPYQYTLAHVSNLHRQRIHAAERIRALAIENESERDSVAFAKAKEKFESFSQGEGRQKLVEDVLSQLLQLRHDPGSLSAARELTRQGIVLSWSAIEVLSRDAFVYLLNSKPNYTEILFADSNNRKRFSSERIEWQALAAYGYDLSENMGRYLISKADMKSASAIRDVYSALFPAAIELQTALGDRRLWNLNQKRNLIVHKRGVVDQQFIDATGEIIAVGETLAVEPDEVEATLEIILEIGTQIIRHVAIAVK